MITQEHLMAILAAAEAESHLMPAEITRRWWRRAVVDKRALDDLRSLLAYPGVSSIIRTEQGDMARMVYRWRSGGRRLGLPKVVAACDAALSDD